MAVTERSRMLNRNYQIHQLGDEQDPYQMMDGVIYEHYDISEGKTA